MVIIKEGQYLKHVMDEILSNCILSIPGKHPETAYFAYFSRELGEKAYLCIRKISNTGLFKPYARMPQGLSPGISLSGASL